MPLTLSLGSGEGDFTSGVWRISHSPICGGLRHLLALDIEFGNIGTAPKLLIFERGIMSSINDEIHTSLTLNKKQGEEIWLLCPHCGVKTRHKVLASVEREWKYERSGELYMGWEFYQIVQCQGCEQPSFREVNGYLEDTILNENGVPLFTEYEVLYPSRLPGRRKLQNSRFLPLEVERIYQETFSALSNRLWILAGIGIRALVEAICRERKAQGSNLSKKIDNLVAQGILTRDGAEVLHSLRLMGNVSAHEMKPYREEDLNAAFEVVEHLLKGVYILPRIAEKLPQRKNVA